MDVLLVCFDITLVIVKVDVTCYEGMANIRAHNAHYNCSDFGLKKLQIEECFTKGMLLGEVGDDFTFGCKQEDMDAFVGDSEFTSFCKYDLCNC